MTKYSETQQQKDKRLKRKRRKSRKLALEDFEKVMHLRQKDAAKELDVCLSSFKRCFATLGLKWPSPNQRKVLRHHRSIQKKLKNVCASLSETDDLEPSQLFRFSSDAESRPSEGQIAETESLHSETSHFGSMSSSAGALPSKRKPLFSEEDIAISWESVYNHFKRAKTEIENQLQHILTIKDQIASSVQNVEDPRALAALLEVENFCDKLPFHGGFDLSCSRKFEPMIRVHAAPHSQLLYQFGQL